MRILRFLCRSVNQTWVRRRVLGFELLDRLEIRGIRNDLGESLQWFSFVSVFLSSATTVLMIFAPSFE
jgi:hypothetical protein